MCYYFGVSRMPTIVLSFCTLMIKFSKDLEGSARKVYDAFWREYKSLPGTLDDIL